jgi:ribose transport system ATP-binding protein
MTAHGALQDRAPALLARGLAKRFGEHLALAGVDLEVAQGEVVALLGENGSGKSTLVKILAGYHVPEPGAELWVGGQRVPLPVPSAMVRQLGLSFVFQDLGLAPGLRVVENLFARERLESTGPGLRRIAWGREVRLARRIFEDYGVDLDPRVLVADLRPTAQALLAIVRAAWDLRQVQEQAGEMRPGLLVLDEPTVFLPEHEKVFLFDLVRRVTARGTGVLFVSHDLTAVRQVAQRAVVLRDGQLVGNLEVALASDEELVERISGHRQLAGIGPGKRREAVHRDLPATPSGNGTAAAAAPDRAARAAAGPVPTGGPVPEGGPVPTGGEAPVVLEVRGARGGRLQGVDLQVRRGEIVAVAGLLGSGSDELPYLLFGDVADAKGEIRIGTWQGDLRALTPRRARAAGAALVPADRKRHGAAGALAIQKNLLSLVMGQYYRQGVLRHGQMRSAARDRCEAFAVRPPDPDAPLAALSGGNQQKVVLAKWIEALPTVLLLHEPTQGVDVATRSEIYELMRSLRAEGLAVLWVSTDFDELAAVADRILVCAAGRIVGQVPGPPFSRDRIASEVYGATSTQQRGANHDDPR